MKSSVILTLTLGLLFSCGGDDDDSKADDAFEAVGSVTKATTTSIELTFTDGEAGAQYFIMPYSVGETSGNPVNGGSASTPVNFTVTATKGASLGIMPQNPKLIESPDVMDGKTFDHALRSLLNRFDPADPRTWQRADELEQMIVTSGPYATYNLVDQQKNIRKNLEILRDRLARVRSQTANSNLSLVATCPGVGDLAGFGTDSDYLDSSNVTLKAESTDYCLYVHNTKGLVTETSVDVMKTSIETALANYKTIYDDTFSSTKDSYKFQPLIIVIPYGDSSYWPDPNSLYKVSAAFIAASTVSHGRPTLYVASDQSAVGSETDSAKLNELFHSSIAHELQHAVLHYYRYTKGLAVDSVQFDEGLAHYMEDLMGYGEVNFAQYPQQFITTYAYGTNAILPDITTGSGAAYERGAAQLLFYYLISQKGGASFSDGLPAKSSGLDFVKSFASGSKTNIEGLVSAYGVDWTETMGNLFGALAVDNATTVIEGEKYKVQSPESDIKNTIGAEGKVFGLRFNNYGGIPDMTESLSNYTKLASTAIDLELSYYQTQPLLLELSDPSDKVTITMLQQYTNTAVSVVRFK